MTTELCPQVLSVGRALPVHFASQEELIAELRELWSKEHFNIERLEELHRAVLVKGRHLARPLADYLALDTFKKRNDAWIDAAVELGEQAIRRALDSAGLGPRDVDFLFFVTVTGIATPSIDARLMNRLHFRDDVKRTPIFGLGCVAGAAGLARLADVLPVGSDQVGLLLSVELCSLTLQREDVSVANIIASGLFGDGAAAVVLSGGGRKPARRGPRVVATRSVFYPDTERLMGWDMVDTGFKVVLSAKVPELAKSRVRADAEALLCANGLALKDITHWVAHTGGPKVLQAFETALELPKDALARSWKSLAENGNLSSASVLFVLGELLESDIAQPGEWGLLFAMGPGFCSELVLLQW